MQLDNITYPFLVQHVDVSLARCPFRRFTEFTAISKPILSVNDINTLVSTYKTKLPSHYSMMKSTLGISEKESKTKNNHLVTSGYYDRLIFYQF